MSLGARSLLLVFWFWLIDCLMLLVVGSLLLADVGMLAPLGIG